MSRFHIHKPFENELAQKADEFSMQPRASSWQSVEQGLNKSRAIQNFWKITLLSLSIFITISIVYYQNLEEEIALSNLVTLSSEVIPYQASSPKMKNTEINKAKTEIAISQSKEIESREHFYSSLPEFTRPYTESLPLENSLATPFDNTKIATQSIKPKSLGLILNLKNQSNSPVFRRRPSPENRRDGWWLQASLTPNYAFRNITARTEYASPLKNRKNELDKAVPSFSAKINARYHFSERFSIAFGLGYNQSGENIGISPPENNPTYQALAEEYGYKAEDMNSLGKSSYFKNRYTYLELPFTLYAKKPLSTHLSLSTGVGVSVGYLIGINALCYDYRVDHYVNNQKFIRNWTLGAHIQALFEYSLSSRWVAGAGPELNYALLSTYQNYYSLSQHQFSAGLNVNLQWKIFDGTKSRSSRLR